MTTHKTTVNTKDVETWNREPLAHLNRNDLIEIIYEQEAHIKHMQRVQSLGWGLWKFEDLEKQNGEK